MSERVFLFNLPFFSGTTTEFVNLLDQKIHTEKQTVPFVVMTPNPEQIMRAQRDTNFQTYLRGADALIPDGIGLVWASQLFGKRIVERIAGRSIVEKLLPRIDSTKVLVIGGRSYAAQSGDQNKKFGFFWTDEWQDEGKLLALLEKIQPLVIFVALGAPKQERFITQHYDLFVDTHVRVVMAVGGAFDPLLGKVKKVPHVIEQMHLEWAFRLLQEPWRWRRQLNLLGFGFLTLKTAAAQLLRTFFGASVHTE